MLGFFFFFQLQNSNAFINFDKWDPRCHSKAERMLQYAKFKNNNNEQQQQPSKDSTCKCKCKVFLILMCCTTKFGCIFVFFPLKNTKSDKKKKKKKLERGRSLNATHYHFLPNHCTEGIIMMKFCGCHKFNSMTLDLCQRTLICQRPNSSTRTRYLLWPLTTYDITIFGKYLMARIPWIILCMFVITQKLRKVAKNIVLHIICFRCLPRMKTCYKGLSSSSSRSCFFEKLILIFGLLLKQLPYYLSSPEYTDNLQCSKNLILSAGARLKTYHIFLIFLFFFIFYLILFCWWKGMGLKY